jgi:hypothetical protein
MHYHVYFKMFYFKQCFPLVLSPITARPVKTVTWIDGDLFHLTIMATHIVLYKIIFLALTLAFSLNQMGVHQINRSQNEISVYSQSMRQSQKYRANDIFLPVCYLLDIPVRDESLKMLGHDLNSDTMKKVRHSDGTFHYYNGLNDASYSLISVLYIILFQCFHYDVYFIISVHFQFLMYIKLFQFFQLYLKAHIGQASPIKVSPFSAIAYYMLLLSCTYCFSTPSYSILSFINQRLVNLQHGCMAQLSWSCVCSKRHKQNE